MIRFLLSVLCLLGWVSWGFAGLVDGNANAVLGQQDFSHNGSNAFAEGGLNGPASITVDKANGRVFVTDTYNHRVLWWNTIVNFSSGCPADGVLGQPDLEHRDAQPASAGTLFYPSAVCVDPDGNLWVADQGNSRVVRYSGALRSGMNADLVLGQADFLSDSSNREGSPAADTLDQPTGVFAGTPGDVWVADTGNNRVLKFTGDLSNGMDAVLVLGQANFIANLANRGNVPSANTVHHPHDIFFAAPDRLWVADSGNHRVLRYTGVFQSGMDADLVLGQPDFGSSAPNRGTGVSANTLNFPVGLAADSAGSLLVSDSANHRIVSYGGAFSCGMNAGRVLGQAGFTASAGNRGGNAGANSLNGPKGLALDRNGDLWVAEQGNHRVLKFNSLKITSLDRRRWPAAAVKELTVRGEGIAPGTTARLTRPGQSDIVAADVAVSGENELRGDFALAGVAPGSWTLELSSGPCRATMENAIELVTVKLSSVEQGRAANDVPADVTVKGEDFFDGMGLTLSRPDAAAINAQFVALISTVQAACRFDISDAATGFWNVSVVPSGSDSTLAGGFEVHFATSVERRILRPRAYRTGIETTGGQVVVDIPPETFGDDVTLTIARPGNLPLVNTPGLRPTDASVEITNDKGLSPAKEITLSFYGSATAGSVVACYDTPSLRWVPIDSRVYGDAPRITGRAKHLSIFRVLRQVARENLSGVCVYPNPYRPASGTIYDDSVLGRGVVFSGLTGRARIRIFTIAGEEVTELSGDDGTGVLLWDTRNDKNERAASGVYLYYITNPDDRSQKAKGKFAIIR